MEDAGICDEIRDKYRPHVTFLVSDTEPSHFSNEVKNLKNIDITLTRFDCFSNNVFVTYLCIEKDKPLMDFFHRVHLIKNRNNEKSYLKKAEDEWIPHCTLSNRITNIAYKSLTDRNSPLIKGNLSSLGIIGFPNDRSILEEILT